MGTLVFFLKRKAAGAAVPVQSPFGPDGATFRRGVTIGPLMPGDFGLQAVEAGKLVYDDGQRALRLSDFKDMNPTKVNGFEKISAYIYRGVTLNFDAAYDATDPGTNFIRWAFDKWSANATSTPYLEKLIDLEEAANAALDVSDVYAHFASEVRAGKKHIDLTAGDVANGLLIGDTDTLFTFEIETTTPGRPYGGQANLHDPASFWKAKRASVRSDDLVALDAFLAAVPLRCLIELRDSYNAPVTRPPDVADPSLDAPHAGAFTVAVSGSAAVDGTSALRGVIAVAAASSIQVTISSKNNAPDRRCYFWASSPGSVPSSSSIVVALGTPPTHEIVQVLRPADWFTAQAGVIDPATYPGAADQTALERYTDGNEVLPFIDGEEYFRDILRLLDLLPASVSAEDPTYWHHAGWSMDPGMQVAGTPVRQLLERHSHRLVLLLCNLIDAAALPERLANWSEYRRLTQQASLIPPATRSLFDTKQPTLSSVHQKISVVRTDAARIAYCGGIDFWRDRLTGQSHDDSRTEGNMGQHDVQLRIVGPAATELDRVLYQRWVDQRPLDNVFPAPGPLDPAAGTQLVQIARTVPRRTEATNNRTTLSFAHTGDSTLRETLLQAIANARQFIYIEDQYLWNPRIAAAIANRLPALQFVVIIIGQRNWGDEDVSIGNPAEDVSSRAFVQTIAAADAAARQKVRVGTLIHPSGQWIYVHAKLQIIDDVFVSCGSANMDVRGLGALVDNIASQECNAMVIDQLVTQNGGREFARELRLRLWAEHLGVSRNELSGFSPVEAFHAYWANIPITRADDANGIPDAGGRAGMGRVNIVWP